MKTISSFSCKWCLIQGHFVSSALTNPHTTNYFIEYPSFCVVIKNQQTQVLTIVWIVLTSFHNAHCNQKTMHLLLCKKFLTYFHLCSDCYSVLRSHLHIWKYKTILWNDLTIKWIDLTWNNLTWNNLTRNNLTRNNLTMKQNDHKPTRSAICSITFSWSPNWAPAQLVNYNTQQWFKSTVFPH